MQIQSLLDAHFLIISIFRSPTASQFTQEDQEFLRTFDSREAGLGGLRNPLHLAAAISPLCLLLPKDLSKKHFHRQTLIEASVVTHPFRIFYNT